MDVRMREDDEDREIGVDLETGQRGYRSVGVALVGMKKEATACEDRRPASR